jgi:hypothetical protein
MQKGVSQGISSGDTVHPHWHLSAALFRNRLAATGLRGDTPAT